MITRRDFLKVTGVAAAAAALTACGGSSSTASSTASSAAASSEAASAVAKLDKVKVAVPNDTTNEARALTLLEKNGFFKLKADAGLTDTAKDKYPLLAEFLNLATTEGEKRSDTLQATMYANLLDVMSQQLPLLASGELDAKGFCQTLTDAAAKNQ